MVVVISIFFICYYQQQKIMRRINNIDIIKPCTVFALCVRALGTTHRNKWSYKMKHFQLQHEIIIIHDTHCCTVSLSLIVIKKNFNLTWNCSAHTQTHTHTNEFIQFYKISQSQNLKLTKIVTTSILFWFDAPHIMTMCPVPVEHLVTWRLCVYVW